MLVILIVWNEVFMVQAEHFHNLEQLTVEAINRLGLLGMVYNWISSFVTGFNTKITSNNLFGENSEQNVD